MPATRNKTEKVCKATPSSARTNEASSARAQQHEGGDCFLAAVLSTALGLGIVQARYAAIERGHQLAGLPVRVL